MRSGRRATIAAAILGIVVAVVLLEVGLRALGLGDPILYDNRLAYGYRPVADQARARLGGARVHVNALATRGPEAAPTPPPGTVRVLFLGDSVTWGGSYVGDHELFSAIAGDVLRDGLAAAGAARPVETLNAGVNGWGPQNVFGLLRETGGFASTVWVVTALEDGFRREKTHAGEVPYFDVAPATALEEALVLGAYKLLTRYKRPKPAADLERLGTENVAVYRTIAEMGLGQGATVLYVWHAQEGEMYGEPAPHREPFLATPGTAGLDLTATYEAATDDVWVDGMHLTVAGHRIAGTTIGNRLLELLR